MALRATTILEMEAGRDVRLVAANSVAVVLVFWAVVRLKCLRKHGKVMAKVTSSVYD